MHAAGELLSSLAAVHGRRVVHGNICPSNVSIAQPPQREPQVKLGSFTSAQPLQPGAQGIAMASLDPVLPDAAPYSAPERWASRGELTQAADVFSAAVVIYEVLAGQLPHSMVQGDMRDVQRKAPRRPGVPDRVFDLLAQCMRRNPVARLSAATACKLWGLVLQEQSKGVLCLPQPGAVLARGREALVRLALFCRDVLSLSDLFAFERRLHIRCWCHKRYSVIVTR